MCIRPTRRSRSPICGCSHDDHNYFPVYQAVWVARKAFVDAHPREWQALLALEGRISEEAMLDMNAQADIQKMSFAKVAAQFLGVRGAAARRALQATSCAARASICGWWACRCCFQWWSAYRSGVTAVRFHAAGQAILLSSALIQTVPSLALLCFLDSRVRRGHETRVGGAVLVQPAAGGLNTFTGIRAVNPASSGKCARLRIEAPAGSVPRGAAAREPDCCSRESRPPPSSASARRRWRRWWGRAATAPPSSPDCR